MTRIAVVQKGKCNAVKCNELCLKKCPVNRTGEKCIINIDNKAQIDEELCNGCGICQNVCPYEAVHIINLPEALKKDPIHQFGKNGFRLFKLPIPIFGKVVGILGRNGIGKTTAIKILAGLFQPNLGNIEKQCNYKDLIEYFKGTEAQSYFEKVKQGKITISYKPQQVDLIPKSYKGKVKDLLKVVKNKQGIYYIQIGKDFGMYRTVWSDKRYDANEYGTKIVNSLVKDNTFSFPKSLWNVYDCIYAVVGNDKNAIVLDYHAGSGTTAHAVLELNKEEGGDRKFIMIEQLDEHIKICNERNQKVLAQENIDDSFIYFELAKWNETAKEKILACESLNELITFFDEMYERYFLNYNLKIKEFREKVIKEEEFKNLSLDEQKNMFMAMLDNNQMYVNKTEMADKKFGMDKKDQKLTSQFYNSEI